MQDDEIIECADILSDLGCTKNSEQLAIFANLLAIAISKGRSADQLNVIGNFVSGVGTLISTISAQKSFCESKQDKLNQIRELKEQIQQLENNL